MVNVNLIPQALRDAQDRGRRLRVWVGIVLAVIVVALVYCGVKYLMCLREDREFQTVQRENQQLDSKLKTIAHTESQLAGLQGRLAVGKELGRYPDFLEIIGFLTERTPREIYLSEIDFNYADSKENSAQSPGRQVQAASLPKLANMFALKQRPAESREESAESSAKGGSVQLILRGHGPTHLVTAGYLTVLKSCGLLQTVTLNYARRESQHKANAIEFEIVCTLNASAASHSVTRFSHDYQ